MRYVTTALPGAPDAIAPDGSAIRLLPRLAAGSMVHCALPAGACSLAVAHRTVEEIWYCVSGEGEVWRSQGDLSSVERFAPGTGLTIPLRTHFQFRACRGAPLEFICVTMPPWPGDGEAYRVADHWPVEEVS